MSDMGSDKILHYPGIENLSLLTSGHITPNPIDMLNSPETVRILKEMAEVYDIIILDCPPVLLFADALIWATTHQDRYWCTKWEGWQGAP